VLDGTPAPSLLPVLGNTVTTSRPAQLAA